jgi:hypothetical protein
MRLMLRSKGEVILGSHPNRHLRFWCPVKKCMCSLEGIVLQNMLFDV